MLPLLVFPDWSVNVEEKKHCILMKTRTLRLCPTRAWNPRSVKDDPLRSTDFNLDFPGSPNAMAKLSSCRNVENSFIFVADADQKARAFLPGKFFSGQSNVCGQSAYQFSDLRVCSWPSWQILRLALKKLMQTNALAFQRPCFGQRSNRDSLNWTHRLQYLSHASFSRLVNV